MADLLSGLGWREAVLLAVPIVVAVVALLLWIRASRAARDQARAAGSLRRRLEAIESAPDPIAVVGPGDRFVYANAAAAGAFGWSDPRELFGKGWRACFPEDEVRRLEREVMPELRRLGRWTGEATGLRRDGETFPLELSLGVLEGGAVAWVARDGTWRTGARRVTDREHYRSLIQEAGSVIVLLDAEGRVREWNMEAARLFGRSRGAALGVDFLELVASEADRDVIRAELQGARAGSERRTFETAVGSEGTRRVLWNVAALRDPAKPDEASGEPGTESATAEALVAVGHDVTERRQAEEALREQESLYRLLAQNSTDLIALHDPDGTFEYVSPSCANLLGYSREELLGRDPYALAHSDDWKRIQTAMVAARAGRLHRTTVRLRNHNGEYVWFETLFRPIRDESGETVQLQSSSRDISERKAFEEQLEYQALHEPLTGLPNRTLFMDRLKHALARGKREGSSVAVMFMDLDRFKVINDSLGHAAGDRLLTAVAKRLRACLREADTVARLGGDEFAVLLEFNIAEADVGTVADRVVRQLQPPFGFAGTEVFVTTSIGIAFSSEETQTPEDLLRYADVAMYRAKEEGPGKWRIYDPALDAIATRRLELETALRRAMEREELAVFYQPIIRLDQDRMEGVEALLRWNHPKRGLVGPGEFIPVAEESGLIVPIGYWVMRQACRQVAEWERDWGRQLVASVNLSSRQLEHPSLEEEIQSILEEAGLEPDRLQLEITESELIQSSGRVQLLKDLGVRVAIDDFGTGYSSLSYLRNLRVDALKVDRSFVQGLDRNKEDRAIVHTVVTLAAALGLEVTAEGVETAEQLAALRELGCHAVQGYYFARPDEPSRVSEMLRSTAVL